MEAHFSVGNIAVFIRIVVEKKLQALKPFLYKQNKVPNITWSFWAEISTLAAEGDYKSFLDELYRCKYENADDMTTDDKKILARLFDIKDSDTLRTYQKLSMISEYIKNKADQQDWQERKPDTVLCAINTLYSRMFQDDSTIEDLMNKYYTGQDSVTLDTDEISKFADYMIQKMFTSIDFIKLYISMWGRNSFAVISKTANQVLRKYKDDPCYDEICDTIKKTSRSWVYSSYHKQFVFLDNKNIGHTDGVMNFAASHLGYDRWQAIPIEEYPICDDFVQKYIEIKGANDEEQSRDRFHQYMM